MIYSAPDPWILQVSVSGISILASQLPQVYSNRPELRPTLANGSLESLASTMKAEHWCGSINKRGTLE
jgi:hypothetical protein